VRGLTKAFAVASIAALVVAPVYLVMSTAQFSLRSTFDFGEVLPLLDGTEFGKGFLMLELCFALFVAAAAIAIWLDDPQRPRRTIADLLATTGALLAAAGVLFIPGTSGHPGTAEPRGLAILLDAVHLGAGSIWLGGLIGLVILWRTKQLPVAFRRFSSVALWAVGVLVATGIWASIVHLPTLASLWETGYGQWLLVKIALLVLALLLAAVNLLRTKTRLLDGQRQPVRFVGGEVVLIAGAVFAAAIVTSLAPPAKAIAEIGKPVAEVGPGPVSKTVKRNGYELTFGIAPNRAATQNQVEVVVRKDGKPVTGAAVTETFAMLDMEMGRQEYELTETAPGTYGRETSALVMAGRWGLTVRVQPPGAEPFTVTILDHADG
jgi:copper transport protein